MAGEIIDVFNAASFFRESGFGYAQTFDSVMVGAMRGVGFPKLIQAQVPNYYQVSAIVPAVAALATGITVRLALVDDGTSTADLNTAVRFGVTACNLSASGALVDWSVTASKGAEQAANFTLSATAGNPIIGSIAVANAQLASLAVGNILGLRIRRIGDNVGDTCPGRVVLLNAIVTNT